MKKSETAALVGLWSGSSTMAVPVLAPLVADTALPFAAALGIAAAGGLATVVSWGSLQKATEEAEGGNREA